MGILDRPRIRKTVWHSERYEAVFKVPSRWLEFVYVVGDERGVRVRVKDWAGANAEVRLSRRRARQLAEVLTRIADCLADDIEEDDA